MSIKSLFAVALLAAADLVAGHGAIIKAVGDAGGEGMAIGVVPDTPRDGTRRNPFQQDSTRFKNEGAATFGETVGGGTNDIQAGTKAVMAMTGAPLPQVKAGGTLTMTLHQVNGDGAGPYECKINADATGAQWTNTQVTQNVPGTNSNRNAGAKTDFPLAATVPAGQSCTGTVAGQENVCVMRCQNGARAGPFGGAIPFQMAGAGANATAARRALARSILDTERALKLAIKRRDVDDEEEDDY